VKKYKTQRHWDKIALELNSSRDARSCKNRWCTYLKFPVWTLDEDEHLRVVVREVGMDWRVVAKRFPDRSARSIAHYWTEICNYDISDDVLSDIFSYKIIYEDDTDKISAATNIKPLVLRILFSKYSSKEKKEIENFILKPIQIPIQTQ